MPVSKAGVLRCPASAGDPRFPQNGLKLNQMTEVLQMLVVMASPWVVAPQKIDVSTYGGITDHRDPGVL